MVGVREESVPCRGCSREVILLGRVLRREAETSSTRASEIYISGGHDREGSSLNMSLKRILGSRI
jgi:hypothetical protein